MRILGIDPGSRATGYGVVEVSGSELGFVAAGTIRTVTEGEMSARLKRIYDGIGEIVTEHQPDLLAIEQVFVSNNPKSALILGQARGVAMCAGANHELPVFEYAAREIKLALVGKGSADKSQVSHMVRVLLGLNKTPASDAADALACAICHAHTARFQMKVASS